MIRMRWMVFLAAAALAGCGAGRQPSLPSQQPSPAEAQVPVDSDKTAYEQITTGSYQINAALDAIKESRDIAGALAPKAGGQAGDVLQDVTEQLDDAASGLSEHSDDPPTFEEFKKDFADYDEERLKTISACTDALGVLEDAQNTISDLEANAPAQFKDQIVKLDDRIGEAGDALDDAVKGLGGKVPDDL